MHAPRSRRSSWPIIGMIALPFAVMTIYLLWIWPRPRGASFLADVGPFIVCLLTGIPFAFFVAHGVRRALLIFLYLIAGFVLLWAYALAMLCGVRGVCL